MMRRKVLEHNYRTAQELVADFRLLCCNAMLYKFPHLTSRTSNVAQYADALLGALKAAIGLLNVSVWPADVIPPH